MCYKKDKAPMETCEEEMILLMMLTATWMWIWKKFQWQNEKKLIHNLVFKNAQALLQYY